MCESISKGEVGAPDEVTAFPIFILLSLSHFLCMLYTLDTHMFYECLYTSSKVHREKAFSSHICAFSCTLFAQKLIPTYCISGWVYVSVQVIKVCDDVCKRSLHKRAKNWISFLTFFTFLVCKKKIKKEKSFESCKTRFLTWIPIRIA